MRAILLCTLVGCSSGSEAAPADARVDVETDAPIDAPVEAESDVACTLVKPYSTKDTRCNDCVEKSCCTAVNDCLGDTRCDDDYVNCILACAITPDDAGTDDAAAAVKACVDACGSMFPEGKKLYDQAIGCAEAKCGC